MAIFRITIDKKLQGQSAAAKYMYDVRQGPYAKKHDLAFTESGNMPDWAESASDFWRSVDAYTTRANGQLCTTMIIALPKEIGLEENTALTKRYIESIMGDEKLPYTFSIHGSKNNPHAHVMLSNCSLDGVSRRPANFFKRANHKAPAKGGCPKTKKFNENTFYDSARQGWEQALNKVLGAHGIAPVSCKSLKDQGIDRLPQVHLGANNRQRMLRGETNRTIERYKAIEEANKAAAEVKAAEEKLANLIAQRDAERERQRLAAIEAERVRKEREEAAAKAAEAAALQAAITTTEEHTRSMRQRLSSLIGRIGNALATIMGKARIAAMPITSLGDQLDTDNTQQQWSLADAADRTLADEFGLGIHDDGIRQGAPAHRTNEAGHDGDSQQATGAMDTGRKAQGGSPANGVPAPDLGEPVHVMRTGNVDGTGWAGDPLPVPGQSHDDLQVARPEEQAQDRLLHDDEADWVTGPDDDQEPQRPNDEDLEADLMASMGITAPPDKNNNTTNHHNRRR